MEKGVGASLREARTRRKLTLADVEAATKIRSRYLRAIENEDWDELPGDIYARAFVRTYAGHLGLDAERLAEEVRRGRGSARPGERLPRVEVGPHPVARQRPGQRVPPRVLAAIVSAALVAVLIAVGLAGQGGGGGSTGSHRSGGRERARSGGRGAASGTAAARRGHTLVLVANAEVWVCLLGSHQRPIVRGRIYAAGERAGPFRSGSFVLALGNAEVTMVVDGKQARIEESSSPVGYTIGRDGSVRELAEGERPTCT